MNLFLCEHKTDLDQYWCAFIDSPYWFKWHLAFDQLTVVAVKFVHIPCGHLFLTDQKHVSELIRNELSLDWKFIKVSLLAVPSTGNGRRILSQNEKLQRVQLLQLLST